jgi:hypothetical protein
MSDKNTGETEDLTEEEMQEKIREQIENTEFDVPDNIDTDYKYVLLNYHIKELEKPFKEFYDQVDADYPTSTKLALSTALTLRTVGYPVTIEEIAKDFDMDDDELRKGVKELREQQGIQEELEKTHKEEKRMLLVQNIDYSVDFKQGFNTLLDDLYKEHLEDNNDYYSYDTVLLTCAWMASKLSSFDTDTIYIQQLRGFFDGVTHNDIKNCYLDIFVANEHKINPPVFDEYGIFEHIHQSIDNVEFLDDDGVQFMLPWADDFLEIYDTDEDDVSLDNKTIAMILVKNFYNKDASEVTYGTSEAKIKRIEDKLSQDYGDQINIF